MRGVFLILALAGFFSLKAQTYLPYSGFGYSQFAFPSYTPIGDTTNNHKQWYWSKYAAVSAGFGFYNGGSTNFISVPVGLQLNHPINNNLIAFAGVSAAPTFFNYNTSYPTPGFNKYNPGYPNGYGFGINSRVEMGLMYINDARTFSISGSIGVERSSYPVFPSDNRNNFPAKHR